MMNTMRFRLYGDSELVCITHRLQSIVDGWAGDWLVSVRPQVRVVRQLDGIGRPDWRWRVVRTGEASMAAVGCPTNWPTVAKWLATGLAVDDSPAGNIAPGFGEAVLIALADRLIGESGIAGGLVSNVVEMPASEGELGQPGNGYLSAYVELGADVTLQFLLWPPLVMAWLEGRSTDSRHNTPLVPLRQGLEAEKVTLQVVAGSAELSLSELQSLAVGDVIRLDSRLAEPLTVLFADEQRVVGGHLGAVHGRRAVQLAAI